MDIPELYIIMQSSYTYYSLFAINHIQMDRMAYTYSLLLFSLSIARLDESEKGEFLLNLTIQ